MGTMQFVAPDECTRTDSGGGNRSVGTGDKLGSEREEESENDRMIGASGFKVRTVAIRSDLWFGGART